MGDKGGCTTKCCVCIHLYPRPIPLCGLSVFIERKMRGGVLYETKSYFYPVSIVVHGWIECMGIGAE